MSARKCCHPAGCELLAAPGDIYCEGCGTDRTIRAASGYERQADMDSYYDDGGDRRGQLGAS